MAKNKIGFKYNDDQDETPEASGEILSPEETAIQLTELINLLWLPVDVFAASDFQLTNAQVEEILQGSASFAFSPHQMVNALHSLHFIQKSAGNDLFWLLKKK